MISGTGYNTLSVCNMCMYYFYTMKGHTMFCFGRVGTLRLCFGFKSMIDVTLSAQVNTGVTHKSITKFCEIFLTSKLLHLDSIALNCLKTGKQMCVTSDLITSSAGISCHALLTHSNTSSLLGARFLPDRV